MKFVTFEWRSVNQYFVFTGMTVLMRALDEHPLTDVVYDEVKYLIKERGANPNLYDKQGRNSVSKNGRIC